MPRNEMTLWCLMLLATPVIGTGLAQNLRPLRLSSSLYRHADRSRPHSGVAGSLGLHTDLPEISIKLQLGSHIGWGESGTAESHGSLRLDGSTQRRLSSPVHVDLLWWKLSDSNAEYGVHLSIVLFSFLIAPCIPMFEHIWCHGGSLP